MERFFATAATVPADCQSGAGGEAGPGSPHWLRHGHASHALESGADLTRVRDNLRHASVSTMFEFALWTLAIIRELIKRRFGVSLSEVSVGRLMKRLGFTPQRPLYRAWQQDEELVRQWREQEFPKIAARAKREGAVVLFADESGIRSDHHAGTTWAPEGQTPVVKATGAR